jgi:L-threonylcarbamoyladenylate synthase
MLLLFLIRFNFVMDTKILTKEDISAAGRIIRDGGLVVFPTETVYGLGADAFNAEACTRIFGAKGRPPDNPLIVHLAGPDDFSSAAAEPSDLLSQLFRAFSPGPLTIIVKKKAGIPAVVTGGLDTVALRIPSHPLALALLKEAGVPVAAPSANRSGYPSPTTFIAARKAMEGRVDAVIDGGDCDYGIESTVVAERDGKVVILRSGAVSAEAIAEVIGPERFSPAKQDAREGDERPQSPGMKYRHYRPDAEVIAASDIDAGMLRFKAAGRRCGIILFQPDETQSVEFRKLLGALVHSVDSEEEYARTLFQQLITFEEAGCELIVCELPPEKGLGRAVRDRLLRASGGGLYYPSSENSSRPSP